MQLHIGLSLCIVLAILASTYCGPTEDAAKKLLGEELALWSKCAAQRNISESVLDDVLNKKELPPTAPFKCLTECHLKGMKIMREDGSISWDRVDEINKIEFIKQEEEEKALEATRTCRKSVPESAGGDTCEKAYQVTKCYLDQVKTLNLRLPGPEDL